MFTRTPPQFPRGAAAVISTHPFRWVPSLRHMSTVKIVETLWNSLEDKEALKTALLDQDKFDGFAVFKSTLKQLNAALDDVPLEEPLKSSLRISLKEQVHEACVWFKYSEDLAQVLAHAEDPAERINHFVQLVYNNMGLIQLRDMVESYVKTKDKIDLSLWQVLCNHCVETEIVRLAEGVTLEKGDETITTSYEIYWFHKTRGEFPPRSMFKTSMCYADFLYDRDTGVFNGENTARKMLKCGINAEQAYYIRNVASILYWKDKLNDVVALNEIVRGWSIGRKRVNQQHLEIMTYLLRTMSKEEVMKVLVFENHDFTRLLTTWPWVMFIDDWLCTLGAIEPNIYFEFFHWIRDEDDIAGTFWIDVFTKIWDAFYKRYRLNEDLVCYWFGQFFFDGNLILCPIVFKKLDKAGRLNMIQILARYKGSRKTPPEFIDVVAEEMLVDDDERQLLRETICIWTWW